MSASLAAASAQSPPATPSPTAHLQNTDAIPAYDRTQIFSHDLCVYTCLFIQYAQQEALQGSFYDLSSKTLLVLTGLSTLVEANVRTALCLLAKIVDCITFEAFEAIHEQAQDPLKEAHLTKALSADCFAALSSPRTLTEKFLAYHGPLAADIRENRVRFDLNDVTIQKKLTKESQQAQLHVESDPALAFQYKPARSCFAPVEPAKSVGPYQVGVYSYIGLRPTMEDEHLTVSFSLHINGKDYPVELFCLFDGHGGKACVSFVKSHFQQKLCKMLQQFNPQGLTDKGIWNALKITFVELNRAFKKAFPKTEASGTTICAVMFLDGNMWTANAGDTRALLENNGVCMQLSEDAKPNNQRFERAVHRRGAGVIFYGTWRVDGILATARAIGDRHVGGISARPKITKIPLNDIAPKSQVSIACDGVFDVASSKQVAKALYDHKNVPVNVLAKNLVASGFQAGSLDNLSVIVIRLP